MDAPAVTPLEIVGPVGLRRGVFARACEEHVGHEHTYDHTTLVLSGVIEVQCGASRTSYRAGEAIEIPAGVRHTLKATTADAQYVCIFSHRDLGGVVTQTYAPKGLLVDDPAYL